VEVQFILSTDDEGYTYNNRVNQLSYIGEDYMILKALSNGVSEQDISVSLSVDVETWNRTWLVLVPLFHVTCVDKRAKAMYRCRYYRVRALDAAPYDRIQRMHGGTVDV
jgi:hypothetical protein